MGSRNLYSQVRTARSPDDIWAVISDAFRSVGGTTRGTPRGLEIRQGVNGVSFAFSADLTAIVSLRRLRQDLWEVECAIQWKPSTLSIVCLIVGFFVVGILWVVPILYLFFKPEDPYQQALHRVETSFI